MKKQILITTFILFACCIVMSLISKADGTKIDMPYELYSWQVDKGWNFALLYNTSREKSLDEIFDPKSTIHGLQNLKKRLTAFPRGTTIIWFSKVKVKTKSVIEINLPPKEIVEDVKNYSEIHGVKIMS